MIKFEKYTGKTIVLDLPNVDTDQIMPKQFLTRTERSGYGKFIFFTIGVSIRVVNQLQISS